MTNEELDAWANTLARAITLHVETEWPTAPDRRKVDAICMKLAEEVGELIGAIVKLSQGRTDEDWLTEALKEEGDVMIVLAQLATWLQDKYAERYPEQAPMGLLAAWRNRWQTVRRRKGASYRSVGPDDQPELPAEYLPQPKDAAGPARGQRRGFDASLRDLGMSQGE